MDALAVFICSSFFSTFACTDTCTYDSTVATKGYSPWSLYTAIECFDSPQVTWFVIGIIFVFVSVLISVVTFASSGKLMFDRFAAFDWFLAVSQIVVAYFATAVMSSNYPALVSKLILSFILFLVSALYSYQKEDLFKSRFNLLFALAQTVTSLFSLLTERFPGAVFILSLLTTISVAVVAVIFVVLILRALLALKKLKDEVEAKKQERLALIAAAEAGEGEPLQKEDEDDQKDDDDKDKDEEDKDEEDKEQEKHEDGDDDDDDDQAPLDPKQHDREMEDLSTPPPPEDDEDSPADYQL